MDLTSPSDALAPIAPYTPPYDTAPYARDELLHEVFAATAAAHPHSLALRLAPPDPAAARRRAA